MLILSSEQWTVIMLIQSQEIEEHPSDHSEYERIKTHHDPSLDLQVVTLSQNCLHFLEEKTYGNHSLCSKCFYQKVMDGVTLNFGASLRSPSKEMPYYMCPVFLYRFEKVQLISYIVSVSALVSANSLKFIEVTCTTCANYQLKACSSTVHVSTSL